MTARTTRTAEEVLPLGRLLGYRAGATTRSYRSAWAKSAATVADWLTMCERPYISVSGGKDSTAMACVVASVRPGLPMVHVCSELDLPDNCAVVHELARRLGSPLILATPEHDPWEWIASFDGDITDQANDSRSDADKLFFFEPLERVVREHGFDGHAMGLRKDESVHRLRNRMRNGLVYRHQGLGRAVCTPIADWPARWVLATICAHDMPLSPIYGLAQLAPDPEKIREGWWLPGKASRWGQAVWLRYYYRDIWQRLIAVRPELRRLG